MMRAGVALLLFFAFIILLFGFTTLVRHIIKAINDNIALGIV